MNEAPQLPLEEMVDVHRAAKILGVSEETVRRKAGVAFPYYQDGRRTPIRFKPSELAAYLDTIRRTFRPALLRRRKRP